MCGQFLVVWCSIELSAAIAKNEYPVCEWTISSTISAVHSYYLLDLAWLNVCRGVCDSKKEVGNGSRS